MELIEKTRHFGGQLLVKKKGKEWTADERLQRNVERAHLKAYLRGEPRYRHVSFGYDKLGYPVYKKVNVIYI